jgi:hypothetical protein
MLIRRSGALALLIAAVACAPAAAAKIAVNVRVEGIHKTLLEGRIFTGIHKVDSGDGTGSHKCDGTNGGAGTVPGPTATGALDDAVKLAGLTWAGSYSSSFDDIVVNQIGPDAKTDTKFWGVALQGKSLQVGGCQQIVSNSDEVLWAYDMFSKKHLLRAIGGSKVRAGRMYTVRVVDSDHGNTPMAGALIGGKKTDSKGIARLRFKTTGTKRLKATEADSVRSNQLKVKVVKAK